MTAYPKTLGENNAGITWGAGRGDDDIVDCTFPPGHPRRYSDAGWKKIVENGLAQLDVRHFGALPDSTEGEHG